VLHLKRHILVSSILAALTIDGGNSIRAEDRFSTFGNAQIVSGPRRNEFALWLVSDLVDEEPFAVLEYVPKRLSRFRQLKTLSTRYQIFEGGFGGGSMRFAIGLDTDGDGDFDGHVSVYLGTPPSFDDPATGGWEESGNLIGLPDDELRFDTSQVGGTFYDSYANALALVGQAEVLYVDLIVDAGWAFPNGVQSVLVRDVRINGARFRPRRPRN
jgi:hypothetical protein